MDYFQLGKVVRPQGIKGEIKLKPYTDDLSRFQNLTCAFLKENGQYVSHAVTSARTYKQFAYLKLEGIDSRNQAEELRNHFVYVDRKNAAPLEEGSYYIADLIGCRILDEKNECLGILGEILNTGGVDIYSVEAVKPFMFPVAPGVIIARDLEKKEIVVNAKRLAEVAVYA